MSFRIFASSILLLCSSVSSSDESCANGKCMQDDYTNLLQTNIKFHEHSQIMISDSMCTGKDFTCARSPDFFTCWGDNQYGQLGLPEGPSTVKTNQAGPYQAMANSQLAAGAYHTCAIRSDGANAGKVQCWGRNNEGQLGYENSDPYVSAPGQDINLGTGQTAKFLALGNEHSCAIMNNDQVKCWGKGQYGRLGRENAVTVGKGPNTMGDYLGTISLGTSMTVTAIAAGNAHTCALLSNGKVKCWGKNANGQLGQGTVDNEGDTINQMGQSLAAVDLGTDDAGSAYTAIKIFAGGDHTCAILSNNRSKCWGRNDQGQLGYGNTAAMPNIGDAASELGNANAWGFLDMGVQTGTSTPFPVKTMALGGFHTCAVVDDAGDHPDRVKCWGMNDKGQLGYGNIEALGNEANEMGSHLGSVSLGAGTYAVALSAGNQHSCAILSNNALKCWGFNGKGQLGTGQYTTGTGADNHNLGDDQDEMSDLNLPVTAPPTPAPPPTPPPTPAPTTTPAPTPAPPPTTTV